MIKISDTKFMVRNPIQVGNHQAVKLMQSLNVRNEASTKFLGHLNVFVGYAGGHSLLISDYGRPI